jgi:hypothetical protein
VPYVVDVDSVIDLPGGMNVLMVVHTTDCHGNLHSLLLLLLLLPRPLLLLLLACLLACLLLGRALCC